MKKLTAFIIVLAIIASLSVTVFAHQEETVDISQNSSSFSCTFNPENNTVELRGTINHDVLVKYGSYTICIYKIGLGSTYDDAIKDPDNRVISHAAISIRFDFAVPVTDITDRFAKYALVLSSPEGNTYLASYLKVPKVDSDLEYDNADRSSFKGIAVSDIASASNLYPGTAVVDIDLSSLYGNASNCYLYPMGDTFAYIDKGVISRLDAQITALSKAGSDINLRFLLSASSNILTSLDLDDEESAAAEKKYTVPNVYDPQVLEFICAASAFLAERYTEDGESAINGVILGTKVDDITGTNQYDSESFEEYTEKYVTYMLAVANSMRAVAPKIDVIMPISDANDYSGLESNESAKGADMLERAVQIINETLTDDPIFSVMLEIEKVPFGISNATLNKIINTYTDEAYQSVISVENIDEFQTFFEELSDKYDAAPLSYSVLWTAPKDLSGNALSCAYVYSYYKLFNLNSISGFLLAFDGESDIESQKLYEISNIFRYIDTNDTFSVTKNLLTYFGLTDWSQIIHVKSANKYSFHGYHELEIPNGLPDTVLGAFDYVNFSSSSSIGHWKLGINTKSLKNDYSSKGEKGLHVTSDKLGIGEPFEFYYVYDNVESFVHTPFIELSLSFEDEYIDGTDFEITVVIGGNDSIAYATKPFKASGEGSMILNIGDFGQKDSVEYIKISVRPLSEIDKEISVWINGIRGYSEEHDDKDLASLIKLERLRAQENADESEDGTINYQKIFTVIGVVIASLAIGVILFIIFKKEE